MAALVDKALGRGCYIGGVTDDGLLQYRRTYLLCCDDDVAWCNVGKTFHGVTTRIAITSFFRCDHAPAPARI